MMIERFKISGGRIAEMDIASGSLIVDEPNRYDLGPGFIPPLKSWDADVSVKDPDVSVAMLCEQMSVVLQVDNRQYSGQAYIVSMSPTGNLKISGTGRLSSSPGYSGQGR